MSAFCPPMARDQAPDTSPARLADIRERHEQHAVRGGYVVESFEDVRDLLARIDELEREFAAEIERADQHGAYALAHRE